MAVFPSAATLLCIWHANKAVTAKYQLAFPLLEEWNEFYGWWKHIINSPTEEEYTD